jgi:hypothetical protein
MTAQHCQHAYAQLEAGMNKSGKSDSEERSSDIHMFIF